jgi:hypothetical protein
MIQMEGGMMVRSVHGARLKVLAPPASRKAVYVTSLFEDINLK